MALGELFVVGCWAGTTDATGLVVVWREVGMAAAVERVGHVVWDAHVVEAVFFDGFVVEPGAVAGFPFQAADHAELGCTATGELLALLIANMKREWDGGKYQVM